MIHVVAIITAKPGLRANILKEFRANMPAVHAEKGCIEYQPVIDADGIGPIQTKCGPDTFIVIEKWGKRRDACGTRRGPAHGGLCRQGPRLDRPAHDPCAEPGVN